MATDAPYDNLTAELITACQAAVLATNAYNAASDQPQAEREALLREVLDAAGEGANFGPIGDDVLNGPKVGIYTSDHTFDLDLDLDLDERIAGSCDAHLVTFGDGV